MGRPHRLPQEAYVDPTRVFGVTFCTRQRQKIFAEVRFATAVVDALKEYATNTCVPIYAYCFLPDHVHLVVSATKDSSVVEFVGRYKSFALRAARRAGYEGDSFWQTSFRDDYVHSEKSVLAFARYTLENAVKDGLAASWEDYPYCGSLVFDLHAMRLAMPGAW